VTSSAYAGYGLHDVEAAAFAAVPKGTAWHAGPSTGAIARQISGPGLGDAAPDDPVPVPLPTRAAPVCPARAGAPERIS
jgi:hypothetical protein